MSKNFKRIISLTVLLIVIWGLPKEVNGATINDSKGSESREVEIYSNSINLKTENISKLSGFYPNAFSASEFTTWNDGKIQLKDKTNNIHTLDYRGYANSGSGKGDIVFAYESTSKYNKTKNLYIETYFENNGKVTLADISYFDLNGDDGDNVQVLLFSDYDKIEYSAQDNIYIVFALSNSNDATDYEGITKVKIKNEFSDWSNHWGKNEILYAMQNKWVNEEIKFRPNDAITRAEFIKIVNKSFGFTSKSTSENYNDVKSGDWWYNEVLIAIKGGYIDIKASNFRPNDKITREEVAAIITSIKKNKDINLDKIKKYEDFNKVSTWAQSSVEGAIEAGYMGRGSNKFRPKDNITRAESIVTLSRIVN